MVEIWSFWIWFDYVYWLATRNHIDSQGVVLVVQRLMRCILQNSQVGILGLPLIPPNKYLVIVWDTRLHTLGEIDKVSKASRHPHYQTVHTKQKKQKKKKKKKRTWFLGIHANWMNSVLLRGSWFTINLLWCYIKFQLIICLDTEKIDIF